MVRYGVLVAASLALSGSALSFLHRVPTQQTAAKDTCIAFVSENLAKGNNNFHTYYRFAEVRFTVRAGDVLVYDVYLDPRNPVAKGGIDIQFADEKPELRDLEAEDQNGFRAHGDGLLEPARGKWYTRRIPLGKALGRTSASWQVVFEGDLPGTYVQFVDNVHVLHADGTKTAVYENGLPPARAMVINSGYTTKPALTTVERARLASAELDAVIADVKRAAERVRVFEEARRELSLAKQFLERSPDAHLAKHIQEASALLDAMEEKETATAEEMQAALHSAKSALSHAHPAMAKYTGHLVGHAHIDLQWLWEWQEGIVASGDTFKQALKFMDEFPGFTFSQSSSCIYEAVEEHYPEVFKGIQKKVKSGQWELVGGRVCEGDTNMISPESHARHFLYGQRYFREKFGRSAIVGGSLTPSGTRRRCRRS
jgi:hypothetical protein